MPLLRFTSTFEVPLRGTLYAENARTTWVLSLRDRKEETARERERQSAGDASLPLPSEDATRCRKGAKFIVAQPSPPSALCTANEVAVVIEAVPKVESFLVESFLNAKGWVRVCVLPARPNGGDRRRAGPRGMLQGPLERFGVFALVRAQVSSGDERIEFRVGHANLTPHKFVVAVATQVLQLSRCRRWCEARPLGVISRNRVLAGYLTT
jgi:hypothetical protein